MLNNMSEEGLVEKKIINVKSYFRAAQEAA
jgi:hypothetical protein